MQTLKRGTAVVKRFRLVGLDKKNKVVSIEFMFKARKAENAPTLLYKIYPGDGVTYDPENGICAVQFSEDETRAMRANEKVYMDTRIRMEDGTIPETVIKKFVVNETLFGREVGTDGGGI